MSFATFLADRAAVRDFGEWYIELYLKDPDGAEEIVRLSRHGTPTPASATTVGSDTFPASTLYTKRILEPPELTQSIWQEGRIGGRSLPSWGDALLHNRDGGLDQYRPKAGYTWAGQRCKVFFFDRRDLAGTVGKVFDGKLADPEYSLSTVAVKLRGREADFLQPLTTHRYRGSSYMLELSGVRDVDYGTGAVAAAVTAAGHTGSMTAEGWFWLDSWAATDRLAWGWSGQSPWGLVISSTRVLKLRVYVAGVSSDITSTITVPLLTPCHIAFTISGRDVTFYLWDDDAQTLTTDAQANAVSSATRDAPVSGALYRMFGVASQVVWHDEMRVWGGVARTSSELATYRHAPLATVPASCTHYAKMDDGTGTTVTDSSASAANGTIGGAGTSAWLWAYEGTAELAGTDKPDLWGQRAGIQPALVAPLHQGYQVAGGGPIESIDKVREGGNDGYTDDGDAASFRAFITATVVAGHRLTYLDRGLFRLGSAPTLPITADAKGYNGGALGYVSSAANIIRDVITRRGPKLADPGDLDTTSFGTFDDLTAIIGGPLPEHKTMADFLDFCAGSVGGWWGYVRAATQFHIERWTGPAGTADYDFDETDIVLGGLDDFTPQTLVYEVVVRFRPADIALTEDQVAAAIKGTADWQQFTLPWQEAVATDHAVREDNPGDASRQIIVYTGIFNRADAQAEADRLLALYRGIRGGGWVTLRASGLQATIGKTATFSLTTQAGVTRLGADGATKYSLLSVKDAMQAGEVAGEVWG